LEPQSPLQEWTQPVDGLQESTVQVLSSSQSSGVPVHEPAEQ
jgi:hypothetical protein